MNRERLRDEFLELVRISSVSKREGNVAKRLTTILEGMGGIDRLADPTAFVGAHLARSTIALARSEPARIEQLLDRVVRYDPTAVLVRRLFVGFGFGSS